MTNTNIEEKKRRGEGGKESVIRTRDMWSIQKGKGGEERDDALGHKAEL